jgi:hypothetical protein
MTDMGIADKYLVLKTVPFGMDQATASDWQTVLKETNGYREKLLAEVLKDGAPKFIIADGAAAITEVKRILGANNKIPVININRTAGLPAFTTAAAEISKLPGFAGKSFKGVSRNIPRTHLSFYARSWEGTSGDSVIAANDKFRGFAFAVVAPAWAWKQKAQNGLDDIDNVDGLIQKLQENNMRMPGERIPQFLQRVDVDPSLVWFEVLKQFFKVA